eukprot:gnl/TRDRNA2_/TRDRNA2_167070_c4_seq1.p1 gnl/TRDRNA2_/TRDRNA2_167070_c4~~gnl/TRDRNA2_/TRDRNA2_167070_c4_seq1.p1  ORF type:complete len:346 (-),score=39.13 gnl/TRDRNA2_/TRDRNA2_167070_c4_seq1:100-1035(-)
MGDENAQSPDAGRLGTLAPDLSANGATTWVPHALWGIAMAPGGQIHGDGRGNPAAWPGCVADAPVPNQPLEQQTPMTPSPADEKTRPPLRPRQLDSPEGSPGSQKHTDALLPSTPPPKNGANNSPEQRVSSPPLLGTPVRAPGESSCNYGGTPSPQQAHYRPSGGTPASLQSGNTPAGQMGPTVPQGAAALQFVRFPNPTTPVHRTAFFPQTSGGAGSGGNGIQWGCVGTPSLPLMLSPGIFPLCRPAPHIVTPAPPLPFSSPPHRQWGTHGLTPGPPRNCQQQMEAGCCVPNVSCDYTAACMAEWRRSDI